MTNPPIRRHYPSADCRPKAIWRPAAEACHFGWCCYIDVFPSIFRLCPGMPMTITDTHAVSQPFQAEVSELLHLMVHSVYSETDIFLRELISNASDACDRLRYEAIGNPSLMGDGEAPKIRIIPNKTDNTLTIADNGIGMDRQELIDNLGTIARSGTRSFLARMNEAKDGASLIGQFGVGFYSAFMAADRIAVTSRRAGASEAWTWSSSGDSGFEIAQAGADGAPVRGTNIILHLKKDAAKYLEAFEIERKGKVKLYVRRVFITDDADLLPGYLRFMRGVIDSEDLPLNISREMLQNNPQLAQIRKAVTGRLIGEMETLAEKQPENFE